MCCGTVQNRVSGENIKSTASVTQENLDCARVTWMDLKHALLSGQRLVGVWGTGYIGYSTLVNFAANGVKCLGTDTSPSIVQAVNEGKVPVANLEYWLGFDPKPLIDAGMISATTDWKELLKDEIAVHFIAIPTEKGDKPWDGALKDVTEKIAKFETKQNSSLLMIIESTLTPKKTDELVIPILESAGLRVLPGHSRGRGPKEGLVHKSRKEPQNPPSRRRRNNSRDNKNDDGRAFNRMRPSRTGSRSQAR